MKQILAEEQVEGISNRTFIYSGAAAHGQQPTMTAQQIALQQQKANLAALTGATNQSSSSSSVQHQPASRETVLSKVLVLQLLC